MKKLLLMGLSLIMIMTNISTDIYGASYNVSYEYDRTWSLKGDMYGPGTILYVNNKEAFCLDSLKGAYFGTNTDVSASSIGLSQTDMQKLSLIAWYGYRSKSNPTHTDYFLTQNLIWEYLGTENNFAGNTVYPNKASMRSQLDNIMNQVNNYFKKPSFNGKNYNAIANQAISITDTNKVLSELRIKSVSGAKASISNNILKVTPDGSTSKVTITFDRALSSEQTKTNFIVRNGTSQPVSYLYTGSDPYNATVTINVTQLGDLQLAKKDPNGNLVPNTTFKLSYNADMSNPIGTYTTGSNGTIIVNDLKTGKVYIQEVKVPGYLTLDTTIYEKTVYPNILAYYTAVNQWNKINLQLAKKDPDGNLVPNTTFKLSYNADMSNPIGEYTTGSNGIVIVKDVIVKDVYIQEIDVPDYLVLNPQIYKKTLVDVSSKINYYTLVNEYNTINLQLAKKDPDGNLVPNTTFKLSYNADMSNPIGEYTTGSNGIVIVKDVIVKDVYIQEISVPDYLKLDNTIYKKTLIDVGSGINYYTAVNQWSTGSLKIIKTDNLGNRIDDTRFRVSYDSTMNTYLGEFSTDNNGEIFIDHLKVGKLYIQEIETSDHLILDNEIYSIDISKDNEVVYQKINNIKTSNLIIEKKDNYNNVISNVVFNISYKEDMSELIGTYTTNEKGRIEISNLNVGTVYIQEISAPDYVEINNTIECINIESDKIITYNAVNNLKTADLIIKKTVSNLASSHTQDFIFNIDVDNENIDGKYGDVVFDKGHGTFSLKHNESVCISSLPLNTQYTINEEFYEGYSTYVKNETDKEYIESLSYSNTLNKNETIIYNNEKEFIVDTGIHMDNRFCIGIFIISTVLLFLIKKIRYE